MRDNLDKFLTEFLASWHYDEKNFINFAKEDEGSADYVKAYLRYKKDANETPPDFDNTPEAYDFYKALCSDLIVDGKKLKLSVGNGKSHLPMIGDWMCSVGWMMRFGLINVYENDNQMLLNEFGEWENKKGKPYFSINRKNDLSFLLDNFDKFETFKNQSFQNFVRVVYTRANLIFVPSNLNSRRSNLDFWDIALASLLAKRNGLDKYRKDFQLMLKKYYKEGLFLEDWITEDGALRMLPGHEEMKAYEIEDAIEWEEVLKEMTSRIIARRSKIKTFLSGRSASWCEEKSRWLLD